MSDSDGALATAGHARVICPDMRYSRWALLIFGAGMVLGLAVVAAELSGLARVASATMATGIVLLPAAIVADWRRRGRAAKPRAKPRAKRRPPARRPRKAKR
jgi:hypothetical protein